MLYFVRHRIWFGYENFKSVLSIFAKWYAPVAWHIWLMKCLLDDILWAVLWAVAQDFIAQSLVGFITYTVGWQLQSWVRPIPVILNSVCWNVKLSYFLLAHFSLMLLYKHSALYYKREHGLSLWHPQRYTTLQKPVALSGTNITENFVHSWETVASLVINDQLNCGDCPYDCLCPDMWKCNVTLMFFIKVQDKRPDPIG